MTKINGAKGGTEIVTTGRFAQHEDHVYLAHTARAFCTLCNGNTKETWAVSLLCEGGNVRATLRSGGVVAAPWQGRIMRRAW